MDTLINKKIKNLQEDQESFNQRLQERGPYIDHQRSSFQHRIIAFKPGFVNTEYYAHKKLFIETVRAFRDFPTLKQIKIIIPLGEKEYYIKIKLKLYEKLYKVNFIKMHNSIKYFRLFLNSINKEMIQHFSKTFIKCVDIDNQDAKIEQL